MLGESQSPRLGHLFCLVWLMPRLFSLVFGAGQSALCSFFRTKGLTREFAGLTAVNNVDLTVETGRIHALIGPNGAGKSTLVGMVAGRITPTRGEVWFDDVLVRQDGRFVLPELEGLNPENLV